MLKVTEVLGHCLSELHASLYPKDWHICSASSPVMIVPLGGRGCRASCAWYSPSNAGVVSMKSPEGVEETK